MLRRSIPFFLCWALALPLLSGCPKQSSPPSGGQASSADPDPKWVIQQSPPAKVALVFVHGITGDMTGTWTAPNGETFWRLVDENEQLKGRTDAFVFGFPSYLVKGGSFDIEQAAIRLHQRLEYGHVLNYPAIVFVAHSMGGLVVMRELLTHREILGKVPVVMFYATPMEGALIADIGKRFSPNSALAQLTEANGNAILRMLDSDWKSIPNDKRPHVRCAYENKPVGPVTVVPWSSATRYCEGATPAIEGTHITIVKPDRPGSDAIVFLANALNEFVIGKQFEAKLATPDFTPEGNEHVFVLSDSFGRQQARLLNEGGSALRFTFAEVSDPSLWLTPDDTPRDIPGHDRINMTIGLGRGAKKSEYSFIVRTPIQSDLRVTIRVPDLKSLDDQQEDSARRVAEQINSALTDPQKLKQFQQAATDDKNVPATIVQITHRELSRENPALPDSTQWLLTADLLNSLNWPGLAAQALQNAEKASPAVVRAPYVQFLSGLVAFQSGEKRVFTTADTPILDPDKIKGWSAKQPLTSATTAGLGESVAQSMQKIPALRAFGLSLQGDVEQAKGNTEAAHTAYKEASAIRPSPSVNARLIAIETTTSTQQQNRFKMEAATRFQETATSSGSSAAEAVAPNRAMGIERNHIEDVQTQQQPH